ncbi:hypothetical protein D3C76_558760 [compost metagenome]
MKKIILLILLSITLTGCNKSIDNTSNLYNNKESDSKSELGTKTITEVTIPIKEEKTQNSKGITSIIPSGWRLFEIVEGEPVTAEGDLNKDGISDIAAIIEETTLDTEEAPPRALLIAFGTDENTYSLSIIAEHVVLTADEGGAWGDPFESLTIDRGSVVYSDYGGSNWRWYNKYRFRFQDHDWYLIGATMGTHHTMTASADEEDYNLLTGDYILKITDENGKVVTTKGNRGKKELIKLKEFNIEEM